MGEEKIPMGYGLWPSQISPVTMAGAKPLSDVQWDTQRDELVWTESREGRTTLLAALATAADAPRELFGDRNVRAKVGYGGGDFTVGHGMVIFADAATSQLYRVDLAGGNAFPISPAFGAAASPRLSPDGRWVAYVHHDNTGTDRLALVAADGRSWPQIVASGHDFYMQPAWSPDGSHLAYVAWNQPQMPWDGTFLYLVKQLASAADTGGDKTSTALPRFGAPQKIAGSTDEAILQPEFTASGDAIIFVSDLSGIGQLHGYTLATGAREQLTHTVQADFGQPAWGQGQRTFALSPAASLAAAGSTMSAASSASARSATSAASSAPAGSVTAAGWAPSPGSATSSGSSASTARTAFASLNQGGFVQLHSVDLRTGEVRLVEALSDYTDVAQVAVAPSGRYLACIGSTPALSTRLLVVGLESPTAAGTTPACHAVPRVLARTTAGDLAAADVSLPQRLQWLDEDGSAVHGLFYPPLSRRYVSVGKPPLIVYIHGGPTSQTHAGFRRDAQFFSSRGYAVLYVNYRGSTGYGRDYMHALRGRWGEVDVADAVGGARHVVDAGLADGSRMAIMGGSAGGYTVLQTLVSFPEVFAAGVSMYGIGNQFSLVADTHKFEARYSEYLLGALPEAAALYRERSPEFHAERIKSALAIYQGADDTVVPRNQAEAIVRALQRSGVPHIYHVYEGEGHGFRQAKTLEHFYRTLEVFLRDRLLFR